MSYTERYALTVAMGTMPRLQPGVATDSDSSELITVDVTFADVGRVMTWRQRSQWRERAQISADGRPNYSYVVELESEPEMVGDDKSAVVST